MKKISIEMSQAEALVLFEWLARNDKVQRLQIEDEAEERVLWLLEAQLERQLVEPLAGNYSELLASARTLVRQQA